MGELERLRGVVLVKRGDAVAFEASGGLADDRTGVANAHGIRFQLASVSKQFTATAIMLLAERGSLTVHDPVGNWIEHCPRAWQGITIHHLLSNTSGIGHWQDMPEIDVLAPMEYADELAIIQRHELRNQPGEQFYYSSPGYFLLAHVAQRAADRTYPALLSEEIFKPLGMTSTLQGNANGQPRLATGYTDGRQALPFELDTTGLGAGDLWSTTGDMAIWDSALADRELLSALSWDAMLTRQAVTEAETRGAVTTDGYGYAWRTGTVSGQRIYYQMGDNAGFRSLNCWIPGFDVRAIILTNEETTNVRALGGEVLRAALS